MKRLKNLKTNLLVLCCVSFITGYTQTKNKTSYSISIDESNTSIIEISASFTLRDNILFMSNGANQLPNRWATFVENVAMTDGEGKSIKIEELSDAQWRVNTALNQQVNLSYQVKLDHESYEWSGGIDGVAYVKKWGVFCTGRSLFIANGDPSEIEVEFDIPSSWKVSSVWSEKGQKNTFSVTNLEELMQSIFFAGIHEEIPIKREGFELVFALGGEEIIADKKEFQDLATGVLDYYIDLMGGVPNPSPDNRLKKAVVVINSSNITDGEVIGNGISILIDKNGDPMSQMISRFMFAHEFFHLWNGKSIVPAQDDTEWFKEGFTNYYTLKSLHHINFLNDESYFGILNNLFYQRYIGDDGLGSLSMTMGEEKHAHWGIIYGGGLFTAIAQDMIIRDATNNKKSLDDLMREYFEQYGGTNDRYSLSDIQSSLSGLSGKDQSDFFKKYVSGVTPIPIEEYLSVAGLDAKVENNNLVIQKREASDKETKILKGLLGVKE